MRFGLDIAQHQLSWPEILDRARFAEDAGFDGAWVFDHFKPLYGDPTGPCFEGWTLLAALSAATSRIRLGALVTGNTYRHPSILATQCVTVDHISNGRLEIGIGASWFEPEHVELGIPFPPPGERVRRLDEAVQVMQLLLTNDSATFAGTYYTLDGATYRPRPVQQPHPPIWIGGSGERVMLPLVARRADVWHTFAAGERFAHKWDIVRRHAEEAGRDPERIVRSRSLSLSKPWDEVESDIEHARAQGVSYLTVGWPREGKAHLDHFVTHVVPKHSTASATS